MQYQFVEEYRALKSEIKIQFKDSKWRMYLKMLPGPKIHKGLTYTIQWSDTFPF